MKRTFVNLMLASGLGLFLLGCSSDSSSSNAGHGELLLVNDGPVLKTMVVSGNTMTEVGSATMSIPGTYERAGNAVTITMIDHGLSAGYSINLDFDAGTGGSATDGTYLVTGVVDNNTFVVTDTASGTITNAKVSRAAITTLSGTYTQTDDTVTVTLTNHGIPNGSTVSLDFTSGDAVDVQMETSISVADANTFTAVVEHNATTSGDVIVKYMVNATQFEATMHPSGKWVYTTSGYQCNFGTPMCWGNAYINQYAIDWNSGALTYEGSTYAQRDVDALNDGGGNMPTGLTFSEDGTKLFVHDDRLDGIVMWDVNTTDGSISYMAKSNQSDAYLHGLTVNSDTTRLYNGSNVFEINTTVPSITLINSGYGCNGSIIKGNYLYCADDDWSSWGMNIYELNNTDVPAHVDYYAASATQYGIVNLALANDVIVTSGLCGLETFTFDGVTITSSNEYNASACVDTNREKFRGVDVNKAGTVVAASYFMLNWDQWTTGASGVTLLDVAADGTLTFKATYPDYFLSRIARFVQKP